jgi:hypothetical protein
MRGNAFDTDLDVYVDCAASFPKQRFYILRRALDDLARARLSYRVLDRGDPGVVGRVAIVHVDLTEVPETLVPSTGAYPLCLNGAVRSIHRRLYSTARIDRESVYDGPVIVKTVLNHRGLPELAYRCRSDMLLRWRFRVDRLLGNPTKRQHCPEYVLYPSKEVVPDSVWRDDKLIVERFLPGSMSLPVVKYRYDFFLDVTLHMRAVYDSLLCDHTKVREVSLVDGIPDAVMEVRRNLRLDFGSIDYFLVDGEAVVVDANKTTTCTEDWLNEYPAVYRYLRDVGSCLVEVVRKRRRHDIPPLTG